MPLSKNSQFPSQLFSSLRNSSRVTLFSQRVSLKRKNVEFCQNGIFGGIFRTFDSLSRQYHTNQSQWRYDANPQASEESTAEGSLSKAVDAVLSKWQGKTISTKDKGAVFKEMTSTIMRDQHISNPREISISPEELNSLLTTRFEDLNLIDGVLWEYLFNMGRKFWALGHVFPQHKTRIINEANFTDFYSLKTAVLCLSLADQFVFASELLQSRLVNPNPQFRPIKVTPFLFEKDLLQSLIDSIKKMRQSKQLISRGPLVVLVHTIFDVHSHLVAEGNISPANIHMKSMLCALASQTEDWSLGESKFDELIAPEIASGQFDPCKFPMVFESYFYLLGKQKQKDRLLEWASYILSPDALLNFPPNVILCLARSLEWLRCDETALKLLKRYPEATQSPNGERLFLYLDQMQQEKEVNEGLWR